MRGAYDLTLHESTKSILAATWLGRAPLGGVLLAAQLDDARRPDLVVVLPALARIYSCRRRSGLGARRQFALVALTKKFRAALLFFGTDLVVIRTDQPAYGELAVSGARTVQSSGVQSAFHHRFLDCHSGSI